MLSGLEIRHHDDGMRGEYFIVMPNGEKSRLTYVRAGPEHMVVNHTFVPVPYREQGVAERLVQRVVDDARAAGTKITPQCWFVADEFARHGGEWDDVLQHR